MRTITTLLTATLLGLATPLFAAAPSDAEAREARMSSALSDFRQQQPMLTMPAGAQQMPMHRQHHRKPHRAAKPAAAASQAQ
jgi:hypothetical protein